MAERTKKNIAGNKKRTADTTAAIVLRKAEKRDVATLARWLQEDDYQFLLSGPRFPTLKETKDRLLEQISLNTLLFPTRQTLITETSSGIPFGFITLARIDWRSRTLALEAYFDKKYRETPYPISAGVKAFAYVFQELNMQKVYSFVQGFNTTSLALHEKYGAKPEAILKDYLFKNGKYYDMYIFATFRDSRHYTDLPPGLQEETYNAFLPAFDSTQYVTKLLVALSYLPEKYAAGNEQPNDKERAEAIERYQVEHSLAPTGTFSAEMFKSIVDDIYPLLRSYYKKP